MCSLPSERRSFETHISFSLDNSKGLLNSYKTPMPIKRVVNIVPLKKKLLQSNLKAPHPFQKAHPVRPLQLPHANVIQISDSKGLFMCK